MSEQIITKRCSHCKKIKPLSGFYTNPSRKDGFHNQCKICCAKQQKAHQQTKKFKAMQKRYRQSKKGRTVKKRYSQTDKGRAASKRYNRSEKGRAAQKRYSQSEKGKATIQRCNQSEKGKDRRRRAARNYFLNHPEQDLARRAVKQAIRDGKLPHLDTLKCSCGNQAKQYHHHKGYEPEHWLDVVPVCIKCHVFHRNNHKVAI